MTIIEFYLSNSVVTVESESFGTWLNLVLLMYHFDEFSWVVKNHIFQLEAALTSSVCCGLFLGWERSRWRGQYLPSCKYNKTLTERNLYVVLRALFKGPFLLAGKKPTLISVPSLGRKVHWRDLSFWPSHLSLFSP